MKPTPKPLKAIPGLQQTKDHERAAKNMHELMKTLLKPKPKRKLPTLTKATREWEITRYIVYGIQRDPDTGGKRMLKLVAIVGSLSQAKQQADEAVSTYRRVIVYEEKDVCTRTTHIVYKPGKKAPQKAEIIYKKNDSR